LFFETRSTRYICIGTCAKLSKVYPFDAHCCHMGTAVTHPVSDRVKRQSARMSKITNDGLTRSDTGCFVAVPIWQQWVSIVKDITSHSTLCRSVQRRYLYRSDDQSTASKIQLSSIYCTFILFRRLKMLAFNHINVLMNF